MQLALIEDLDVWQEGTSWVLEGVGKTATEDDTTKDREATHQCEKPEPEIQLVRLSYVKSEKYLPARLASDTSHMKNTIGKQLGRSLAKLITEVKEHDSFSSLLACVPSTECPKSTRNKSRLGNPKQKSSRHEGTVVILEGLEGTDCTEEEELDSQPLPWTDAVEDHVARYLEEHDAQGEHLLADVELVLGYADVDKEIVCQGIGNISSIEFYSIG